MAFKRTRFGLHPNIRVIPSSATNFRQSHESTQISPFTVRICCWYERVGFVVANSGTAGGGTLGILRPEKSYTALGAILLLLIFLVPGFTAAEQGGSTLNYRYLPIGDSYTIGEGVAEEARWPNQLVRLLTNSGHHVSLVGNPGRTGWTTQDALDKELPVALAEKPNLITVLIGVNDWVRRTPENVFHSRLTVLLDGLQQSLPEDGVLILVTIPNFSTTPTGAAFGSTTEITAGLTAYNGILKAEAEKRNLAFVDIFELSRKLNKESGMLAADGLHPSAEQYAAWAGILFPVVASKLKESTAAKKKIPHFGN